MLSNSIRWRLSFTYGAISLLASICLGAILLFTLQQFYRQQEIAYLEKNGRAISNVLTGMLVDDTKLSLIESQLNTLAFLTQTRVELINSNGELLADTGPPGDQKGIATLALQVVADEVRQEFSQDFDTSTLQDGYSAEIVIDDGSQSIRSQASVKGSDGQDLEQEFFTPLNLLGSSLTNSADVRSEQTANVPIGFLFDENIGHLRLSEGPAYGRPVVRSVALGLVLAGGLATVLTSLFGWWLSGRLVQPLDELAKVSQQMGEGKLTVRSGIKRHDEIGRVAVSFNQMAERIDDTVSSLRRFVADAAHEINTPITALKGNLELLESAVSPAQSHLLKQALEQTNRIQTLAADLLQLSELDGAVPIEMSQLDLAELIGQQNERIAAEAEQADIEFSAQLPAEPIWINGHPPSLLSLYLNLIDNALKFTPEGGSIEVVLERGGDHANLRVIDTGIGLNGDTDLIFDRFYRSPQAVAYPGNGLGLAICAKIVEQHGGMIAVESSPNKTQFIVKIAQ